MNKNDNTKSLAKDIGILLVIFVPLLFIIIGGSIWRNGGFDGTIMEELFPVLFFGFIAVFLLILIASNLIKKK